MKQEFYSHGKLLLTGEYVVLDGATALAIPTVYGQSLQISPSETPGVQWTSAYENEEVWFDFQYTPDDLGAGRTPLLDIVADVLLDVLFQARQMNGSFLEKDMRYKVVSALTFPKDWGLGSSSTLINNVAQWAGVDPYKLLERTFGGSGYDIAVAQEGTPLLYSQSSRERQITPVELNWDFMDQLFFVHLNRKQDSREGIARYRASNADKKSAIKETSAISEALLHCGSLQAFEQLLEQHETIISGIIDLPTIKARLFSDYTGCIKSLGAWGGDFVMATGSSSDQEYFKKKGYGTVIPFSEMIK